MRPKLDRQASLGVPLLFSIASLVAGVCGCVQRIVDNGGGGTGGCDARCLTDLGWKGYEAKRRADINQFRGAVSLDSTFGEAYMGLGWFDIEFGYIDAASAEFLTATELDTSLVAAYAGEAFSLAAGLNPDYDGAIGNADIALQKGGPDYVFEHNDQVSARSMHLLLASIYFRLRNYQAALAEVDEIEPANGLDPTRRTFVADLLLYIVQLGGTA